MGLLTYLLVVYESMTYQCSTFVSTFILPWSHGSRSRTVCNNFVWTVEARQTSAFPGCWRRRSSIALLFSRRRRLFHSIVRGECVAQINFAR